MNWNCVLAAAMVVLVASGVADVASAENTPGSRPNVVWIVVDDMSCHFGYQGEGQVTTPHVDRLAREGVVFSRAYATAPVCSTFRSALITGMWQTTIGAHHHRSSRGANKIQLPEEVRTVPELMRAAGYFTTNSDAQGQRPGKEDYNFVYQRQQLYHGTDWTKRKPDQPFFAQYQLRGGKLRNVKAWYEEVTGGLEELAQPEEVILPPYYPNHPVVLEDWAQYLNSVSYTDVEVGRILAQLEKHGALANTIVCFFTDHGISHARGKQFLYEEGIHIPFVVWAPQRWKHVVRNDLVAHIDVSASTLEWAGIAIPDWMQGRPLWGPRAKPRTMVVSARDRCDETVDHIRSVRTKRYKYIRNYLPQRRYLQPSGYKDAKPFMPVLRELYAAGKLNPNQSLVLAESRPAEELYDLWSDPWELHNLAVEPFHHSKLLELRRTLSRWEEETKDLGRQPESPATYDSEMTPYLEKLQRKDREKAAELEQNIRWMKERAEQEKNADARAKESQDGLINDLQTPLMTTESPGPGRRVKQVAPEYKGTNVYHALYLPRDWSPQKKLPVIVEYTGNKWEACNSTGEVKDANLGYGISGGVGFIWVSMPYIKEGRRENTVRWWGDKQATIEYCKKNLPRICEQYSGDPDNVFICGFSRGAIAASYIGLADDEIAKFWKGFFTHDHFDGERRWSYSDSDRASALRRLARLKGRPVLICGTDASRVRDGYLTDHLGLASFTFLDVPTKDIFDIPEGKVIHPHTDLWLHRESPWRQTARRWLLEQVAKE